jgi:hypothetical protein
VSSFRLRISGTSGQLSILLLGLASSGCSFIFVTPPPAHAEQASQPYADCSTSRAAPVIDGIIAGYQVVRTIYATQAPDSSYQGAPISRGADIGLGLGFAGLFLASTIYGTMETSECRDFKARTGEHDLNEERERSTPKPVTPPAPAVLRWGAASADSAAPASSAVAPAPAASPAAPPATAAPPAPSAPKASGAFPAP